MLYLAEGPSFMDEIYWDWNEKNILLTCVTTIVPTAVVACAARGDGGSPEGRNL